MTDSGHVVVRKAIEADFISIVGLFDAYRQFYGFESDCEAAQIFLRRRVDAGDSILFVARLPGGAISGFAQLYHGLSSIRMVPTMVLNDLYVTPEYRGKGIASCLLGAARDEAKAAEIETLSLSTQVDNHTARTLYERDGWVVDDRFVHYHVAL